MGRTIIEVDGVNHVPYTVDEIQIFAGLFYRRYVMKVATSE